MNDRSLRWGALAGTIHVVLILVGNGMDTSGQSGKTDAASILADLRGSDHLVNRLGLVLEVAGFVAFFFFLAALYRILRLAEPRTGWLASAAFAAGIGSVAIKLGSGAVAIAAYDRRDVLSPTLARTLVDIGGGAFLLNGLLVAVFVLAAAMSSHATGALPRWLTVSGFVVGLAGLVTPTVAAAADPQSYVPIPFLLALLWIACVGVVLARRPLRTTALVESAASAAPNPISASA